VVIDSSFDRLRNAWSAAASKRAVDAVKERVGALVGGTTRPNPADQGSVLWISDGAGGSPPIAVTSARRRTNYRIACVQPNPSDDFDALLKQHKPRLLVADVDWCAAIGEAAVRQLHRHHPQVDWLLRWEEPSPRWLATLVHSGARGAVLRAADSIELARAFDAVTAGEIWLPRRVLQWLYATLVDAPRQDSTAALGPSTLPLDSDLTARETEVAALMRQGLTNHDIAKRLDISINTVKKHVANTLEKQGLRSRRQTLG